jgi:methionyl-tRNA formyltransferase
LSTEGGASTVAAGQGGAVAITMLQSPGGKPMCSADWLRGHEIEDGTILE